jgi:single-stranded DNA-binding protein
MTEAAVSFAGNLTDQPEIRYTEAGIARAMFRVAVSGRREQEASFFTVVVWRDQAEHAAESLTKGQPGRGHGPTPAADLDRRGRQRPLDRRGRG